MRGIWIALAVAALLVCRLAVSCEDAGKDATKGAKNTAGIAGKVKASGSGEGGGEATSDD